MPVAPSTASVAADGNPVPTARDLQLPSSGVAGIPAVAAPRGGPVGCVARRPVYFESGPPRRRVVALTFDDGPSGFTPQILGVLERKRVHATFFVIGNQVRDHPELLRRELGDGDMIGDHTWTHADMTQLPAAVQSRQIALARQAIAQATGFETCLWRAPYGAIDARIEGLARGLGLDSIQWNTDPQDFNMPPVAAIIRRVLHGNPADPDPGVRPGAIVLMHDGGGDRSHTAAALPRLIDALRAGGYSFVTVPELLGIRVVRRG
ncbi:MAG: polysaccharide deacetylase family protein [Solirubrobacteraceae bacterium]